MARRHGRGGIVTTTPTRHLPLPPEHAASLTSEAGPDNLSGVMQFIALLAGVEQQVIDCFRHGGGVPYTRYQRFHALMAEDSATVHDAALLDGILPLVPRARRTARAGIDVPDIGCGQGHAVNLMAEAFPASRFTASTSRTPRSLLHRRGRVARADNARFEVCDVTTLDTPTGFDLVTAFDAIHDQAHPGQVLATSPPPFVPAGRS